MNYEQSSKVRRNNMLIASNSASISQVLPTIMSGALGISAIIASAFFGGLFAGSWANHFESKRRISDKRHDKYFEHRNTIVQIEHELVPLRVNISRNVTSIDDAIENTNEDNIRFILRFYKLAFSTGLNLKLLSLDFIYKYTQLYSDIEILNSNFEYVFGMVSQAVENKKTGQPIDPSLIESYKQFLPFIKDECEEVDQKSLELLTLSILAINKEGISIREKYIQDGKEIKYTFNKASIKQKKKDIAKQESDVNFHKNEKMPKFIAPFLDLRRIITTSPAI